MNEDNQYKDSRLATTDEKGNRVYIHPEGITGKWKTRRTTLYWFLILLYLFLPWVHIDGKQWVLLDLAKREFTIFGNLFYGHDGPLLFFLVLGFIFLMAFITSILGRVWCGWACPQTVFIDTTYRKIERLVEGKSRQRRQLDRSPLSFEKVLKRAVKWILFIIVSLHIVHSFLGYFVGTRKLFNITLNSPSENWTLFITMLVMTGIILFDFGWFREQFCIIACPYGRFQSVVMDDDSLIVAYNKSRGEPRRSKGTIKSEEGDCINCNHCVKACPTGIDIRNGTQMECIACTMCIDACDNIMTKVEKPTGLISYTTENVLQNKTPNKYHIRSAIYLIILSGIFASLYFSLSKREEIKAQFIRGSKSTSAYEVITLENKSTEIVNFYKLKIFQNSSQKINLKLNVEKLKNQANSKIKLTSPFEVIKMKKDNFQMPIFFNFSRSILENGQRDIKVNLINADNNQLIKQLEVKLVGPLR